MAHDDRELETLNGAIARAIRELEDEDLQLDARQRLEKELMALVDMRLAIERQANQTTAPAPIE